MYYLYTLVSCIPFVFVSEGRTVQGILGRNVSLSWTLNNTKKDSISISRNSNPLLLGWPLKNNFVWQEKDERMDVFVQNSTYETLTVNISISRITVQDAGIYKLERRWDSEDFNDSVILKILNETSLPWITVVRHVILDLSVQLQCKYPHTFIGQAVWMLNKSVIESHGRYNQNNTLLSIRNLTADDKYNIYTCNELGDGFESDPYRLNVSGPNVVKFASNVTVAKEHTRLNLLCEADCYPICTWTWTQLDNSLTEKKVISTENELQINDITRQDAGKYSCHVHNIITSASLEGFTYLDVVYGPDEIYFNISEKIVQVHVFETISVICYAYCFPPCQFGWIQTNKNTMIRGAELNLYNMTIDVNYTCYATNPMNSEAFNSSSIYIKVRSGLSSFTTTTLTAEKNNGTSDFPSIRHLLYLVLGLGVLLAIGLCACLLHKCMACSHVRRSPSNTSFEHSDKYGENDTPQGEHTAGKYWTIVSNAQGELTTAIDTHNVQCIMHTSPGIKDVLNQKKLEHSIDTNAVIELDEYLEPVHSDSVKHDDYIHPVHTGHVET